MSSIFLSWYLIVRNFKVRV